MSGEVCGDDRFELIEKARARLLDATNIMGSPEEMAVLDSVLFRCWQMGWLDQLRTCEMEYGGDVSESTKRVLGVYFCSECGSPMYNDCMPYYCMYCGAEVER